MRPATPPVAERIEVEGVVQGVGFRPFVHRLATQLGLAGRVGNDSTRVFIETVGPARAIDELIDRLRAEAPPLARVDRITRARTSVDAHAEGGARAGFSIVESRVADGPHSTPNYRRAITCVRCVRRMNPA